MATSKNWVTRLHEIHPLSTAYIKANTPEWYNARRGRLTASTRAQLIYQKEGWPTMLREIEAELDPNWKHEPRESVAMNWGRDNEARALAMLELELCITIDDPGLIINANWPFIAGTPDGMFRKPNGRLVSVQVKCPYNPQRHLDNVYGGGSIKQQYFYQVQWEAMLLGADDILFASFDPRQPLKTQLAIIDVPVSVDIQNRFLQNALEFQKAVDSGISPAVGRMRVDSGIPELFP
jgi:hypothetical protein